MNDQMLKPRTAKVTSVTTYIPAHILYCTQQINYTSEWADCVQGRCTLCTAQLSTRRRSAAASAAALQSSVLWNINTNKSYKWGKDIEVNEPHNRHRRHHSRCHYMYTKIECRYKDSTMTKPANDTFVLAQNKHFSPSVHIQFKSGQI